MKKIVLLLIMSVALFGCKQDAIDHGLPTAEIQAITSASNLIVQDAIQNAIDEETLLNPVQIAEQISQIDGVISSKPNATNSGVVVALEGGLTSLVLLFDKADNRWYVEESENESESSMYGQTSRTKKTNTNIIMPKGNGSALILAPFQKDFKSDLDDMSSKLLGAGYLVDTFLNERATIERFRGDFLCKYDIVIIDSHGGVSEFTHGINNGDLTTSIVTGTLYSQEYKLQYGEIDHLLIGLGKFAITPQWLRATTTKSFKDTWVIIVSCEGAYYDEGVQSYSKAFLDLGARGYNGFDFNISLGLSNKMNKKMVENFTDALSFIEASEKTKNAKYPIYRFAYWASGNEDTSLSPDTFDMHQRGEDPFYIVPPEGYQLLPSVEISSIYNISGSTADINCEVTYEGWKGVTARGVCWSTSQNPTTANSKTTDGKGSGTYTSNMTGLSPNTIYYVRAYATNSEGTAYDEDQISFKTNQEPTGDTFTDSRDGNVYKTVTIGEQVWMAENLAYLPAVSPAPKGGGSGEFAPPSANFSMAGPSATETELKYYVYNYSGRDVDYAKTTASYQNYGVLYNWAAAKMACPEGWHLPSDAEWEQLLNHLGGSTTAGGKMKETGTTHWASPNTGATNESTFTGLAGGIYKFAYGVHSIKYYGFWWSSTESNTDNAWYRNLNYNNSGVDRYNNNKKNGLSVRCVRE
jgi:uncharacterized protein (TIGR02145 family)